jgi:hypothetical protein
MRTNREKYNHYWQEIDAKDAAEIVKLFPNGAPSQFYRLTMYSYEEMAVTRVGRFRQGIHKKDSESRISKGDVADVIGCAEGWTPPTTDEVYVHYEYANSFGRVSGAEKLSKIIAVDGMAWTVEELADEIQRRKALYEPRDGHTPCAYCQKQNPPENMVDGTVIYRTGGGIASKTQKYCKDKPCAGYDQMGHEG